MKVKLTIFISSLIITFTSYYALEWHVKSSLSLTSAEEFFQKVPLFHRNSIEKMFRSQFSNDSFGLILMGEKPMGLCYVSPIKAYNCRHLWSFFSPNYISNAKGWYLWSHYLPKEKNNIVFIRTKQSNYIEVYIANRARVNEYLDFYDNHAEIKNRITGTTFHCLIEEMNNNDNLLGFLLGFGFHNAQLFATLSKTLPQEEFIKAPSLQYIWKNEPVDKQSGMKRMSHNLIVLYNHAFYWDLSTTRLPAFRVDPTHSETYTLQQRYLNGREQLLKTFNNQNFLKKTVDLIFAEPSYNSILDKKNPQSIQNQLPQSI